MNDTTNTSPPTVSDSHAAQQGTGANPVPDQHETPPPKPPEPTRGGSYVRDPDSGALTRQEDPPPQPLAQTPDVQA